MRLKAARPREGHEAGSSHLRPADRDWLRSICNDIAPFQGDDSCFSHHSYLRTNFSRQSSVGCPDFVVYNRWSLHCSGCLGLTSVGCVSLREGGRIL